MTTIGLPVVAGIDGSEHQGPVIEWAAAEARLRGRALLLVHAYEWGRLARPFAEPPYGAVQQLFHDNAAAVCDRALASARLIAADLDVETTVVDGGAAAALVEVSKRAATVVVGHRGTGGFASLLIGSVASQVATHAACPVVVVRPSPGTGPNGGRVVVGVDGSDHSAAAIRYAFEEARLRHLKLTAVHAWTGPPARDEEVLPLVYDAVDVRDMEDRALAEALASALEDFPDVAVRRQLVRGRAAHAFVEAASGGALAVAGTRGRGGFAGLLLGSVSQAALAHVTCPLAIVPSTASA